MHVVCFAAWGARGRVDRSLVCRPVAALPMCCKLLGGLSTCRGALAAGVNDGLV